MKEPWGRIVKCTQKKCKGCFYAKHENVKCEHANKRTRPISFEHVITGNEHVLKINRNG